MAYSFEDRHVRVVDSSFVLTFCVVVSTAVAASSSESTEGYALGARTLGTNYRQVGYVGNFQVGAIKTIVLFPGRSGK